MGQGPDQGIALLTARETFRDWSADFYARPGVEPILLALQDRHALSVNMLLWGLWCGARFETPSDLVIRQADDISRRWSMAVTAPLRAARRALKAPPIHTQAEAAQALSELIGESELAAEKIEQSALERLAAERLVRVDSAHGGAARARKALAIYVRLTEAVKTPGFSVSLIEDLISLRFPPSDSDGDCVE